MATADPVSTLPAPPYAPADVIQAHADAAPMNGPTDVTAPPAFDSTDPAVLAAVASGAPAPSTLPAYTAPVSTSYDVPAYTDPGLAGMTDDTRTELGLPLTSHPLQYATEIHRLQAEIVDKFHEGVRGDNREVITTMVSAGLVSPDVTNDNGGTGLAHAARAGDLGMAKLLVSLGAEPDLVFRTPARARRDAGPTRTALLVAAEAGHLAMVKYLLFLGADDAFLASDGQLALRLAADNKHTEIVELLPARRGGALLRWQTHHSLAIRRIKRILGTFVSIGKFFVWYLPKAILFDFPRSIVEGIIKKVTWCYQHRGAFPGWCGRQGKRIGKAAKRAAVEVPRAAKKAVVAVPRIVRATPRAVVNFVNAAAKRIATVIKTVAGWVKTTVTKTVTAVGSVLARILSGIHTVVLAVWAYISRLRNVTLADVGTAFMAVIRAVGNVPATVWRALLALNDVTYKVLTTLFSSLGFVLYALGWVLFHLVTYIPLRLFEIVVRLGGSVAKGGHEIMVWFNPKW